MIALYAVGNAYAIAVLCAANRLYVLGVAHGLRKALAALQPAEQQPPSEWALSLPRAPSAHPPTPVLQWPRDN